MNYMKELLEFRAKHNLTQVQLAKIFGVASNTIHRYENGTSKPTAMHKIQIENKMKEYEVKKNENVSL